MLVHYVILLSIFKAGAQQPQALEIAKFSSDRVDLLVELARKLTNKEFSVGIEEEDFKQFDSRLRCKKFFEHLIYTQELHCIKKCFKGQELI